MQEMRAGWRFLRSEAALLANTGQAVVAQFGAGILISVTLIYVDTTLHGTSDWQLRLSTP